MCGYYQSRRPCKTAPGRRPACVIADNRGLTYLRRADVSGRLNGSGSLNQHRQARILESWLRLVGDPVHPRVPSGLGRLVLAGNVPTLAENRHHPQDGVARDQQGLDGPDDTATLGRCPGKISNSVNCTGRLPHADILHGSVHT